MKRWFVVCGLVLLMLVACTTPPVVTPNPATGGASFALGAVNAFKLRGVAVRYAPRVAGRVAGPDTLVIDYTAPSPNGGSPITGYSIRSKRDGLVVQTHALAATVFQDRWVITGVGAGQTVQLQACGNAINAAGPGPESCSSVLAYTAADLVPGALQTITVTKKPLLR